jgi:Zn finger protein HypA/HybF involved in hydrogenase expression
MEHSLTETQQDLTGAARYRRRPNTVSDGRFAVKLWERAVTCDNCGDYYTGENVGNWFFRTSKPTIVAEAEEAYRQGHWDATWWCLQCYADEWAMSMSEVEVYFGFTARTEQRRAWWAKSLQRRPSIVKDGRFKIVRKERFFYCDSCHERYAKTEHGAFIHGTDHILAADRHKKWDDGDWDATWYCRHCLKDTHKMTDREIKTLMESTRNKPGYQGR